MGDEQESAVEAPELAARAQQALWALYGCMGAVALSLVLDLGGISKLSDYLDSPSAKHLAATSDRDDLSHAASVICVLGYAAAAAGFIRWLQPLYSGLDRVKAGVRRHDPIWATRAWFLPGINFYRPLQVVEDAVKATGARLTPRNLLTIWWALWVLALVTTFIVPATFSGDGIRDHRKQDVADVIGAVLTIGAAVLAVLVVRGISRAHGRAAVQAERADRPDPPPPTSISELLGG